MSEMTPEPARDDRGPGVPQDFPVAEDGTARLRFPGGRLGPDDWTALGRIAAEHGGDVHVTSRGHLQIRGIRDAAALRDRVGAAGLLPGVDHDRARTIIASPMAGRLDGHHELGELPEQLDAALRSRGEVASLGDRFLFGLDDGSGDVLAHAPDLAAVAGPGGGRVRLYVAGRDVGLGVPVADAAGVLADAAAGFACRAGGPWQMPDSGEQHDLVVVDLQRHPLTSPGAPGARPRTSTVVEAPRVGWVDTSDGLVSLLAVVPFGVVPARLAEFLGAVDRPSTVAADRVIGLHGLTEGMAEQVVRVLAPMGMVFDASSPWVEGAAAPED